MVKVKNIIEKGLSAVRDLVDFFKEAARNRKLANEENKKHLPEMKTFNGIPLRDYCWLKDKISRIEQKRIDDSGKNFACKAVIVFSLAFLVSGLVWIYINPFFASLSFITLAGIILEMEECGIQKNSFLMSFPEYGIWNSEEVKDFKYNFEDILYSFGYRSKLVQGREFERIFTMAGIDAGNLTYKNNLKKTSLLLNIFYGLNDWESRYEMLYDIRKGDFTAAELFKRKNELCLLEKNFVEKGRLRFRKMRKDLELERKEINGKVYWTDEKGFIKIREEFSEFTKFNEKDIRNLLKGVYPSAETITLMCGERFYEKGYVKLDGNGRRKQMMFFKQEQKKLSRKDVEEEE